MLISTSLVDRAFDAVILIFVVGAFIVVTAIICVTVTMRSRSRERTRRENAASVAEDTIDPEKGVDMMKAATEEENA